MISEAHKEQRGFGGCFREMRDLLCMEFGQWSVNGKERIGRFLRKRSLFVNVRRDSGE